MGNPSSKSSFKNNNLSKQINFIGTSDNNSKYSGIKSTNRDHDVLTKFTWNYGGNSVYLTGSFNNWKKNIPMEKQGDQFCITLLLPRQAHQYKFIVDGEWRFSPEDATMSDDNGYINNYIDTTNFQPLIQSSKNTDMQDLSGPLYPKHSKDQIKQKGVGKKQEYAKYAPKLLPYFQHCLYLGKKNIQNNKTQSTYNTNGHVQKNNNMISIMDQNDENPYYSANDNNGEQRNQMMKIGEQGQHYQALLTQQQVQYLFKTPHSLPMPTHVTLDHVMTQEGDWYSAIAITQRFKQKYTTFTYYTIDRQMHMNGNNTQIYKNNQNVQFHQSQHMRHRNSSVI